ncbi:YqeG family HAD IIIA-type phosphatase [Allobacillus sp. GCM10007491]|uniref:YqeG family HAD IIIA-type phosphatase n=1 Tax=Allobacillus saliphilus TaxID=2912308 RepID=A0A941HTJ9_9BACI|nr:YqeG family HAD IIIA-type phosphatase [Allobacillus saliphilus]MBR7553359.1 YqeG family HAD IIIA-type phosphatase [Allobacillus saliphilus]
MLSEFLPSDQVKDVFEITPAYLKERGIKGVITDLDNTLVAWDQPEATPEIIEWFESLKEAGLQVTIISNNNEDRVGMFSTPLNIPFIHNAKKPTQKAFRQARKTMNLPKEEIVVIGDQLLTDVLGGNRAGLYTILVIPVVESDGFFTKFNRMIERRIMNYFKRKGKLNWED